MATNGSASVAVTSHDTLQFNWSVTGQSVENNTSTVYCEMVLIADGYGRISSTVSKSYAVTINGTAYGGSNTVGIGNNQSKVLWSGTVTIPHNADGTKSFSFSFSQQFSITFSGQFIGTISGSGSGTLNTIPRASTIACGTFTMGSSGAITITRASSSFTHTILWAFGAVSGTVVTKATGTSVPWTPSTATMAPQIPSATSGVGTLTCITYSGSTEIGRSTATFTAKLPSSIVPSISTVKATEATSGLASKFGAFVQSKSTLKVAITATGTYGSTIKSYSVTFDGKSYSGNNCTTGTPSKFGSLTLTAKVTDTRGRTASKSITVSVLPYAKPAITVLSAWRCTDDGTADSSGDYVGITYAYTISSVNSKNTASAKIEYKRSTLSSWSSLLTNNSYSANTEIYPTDVLSSDYQWDIRLTVSDFFGSTSMTIKVPSAQVILDLLSTGDGVGIGKTAEQRTLLDILWSTRIRGMLRVDGKLMIGDYPVATSCGTGTGDLNRTDMDPGIYWCNFSECTNGPVASGFGWLIVQPNRTVQQVIMYDSCTTYSRGFANLEWTEWVCTGGVDSVVASGNSGGWTYIKFANGIACCSTTLTFTGASVNVAWGALYKDNGTTVAPRSYPFEFMSPPVEVAGLQGNGQSLVLVGTTANTRTKSVGYMIVRATSATSSGTAMIFAIGRWK